jgi:PAS domain S-box-containing protein
VGTAGLTPGGTLAISNAADEIIRREAELHDFVENAVVAMHRVAPDGTILWANRAEMDFLGYTREEYIGHHIGEFHADQTALADILQCLSRNEELHGHPGRLRHKDGSTRDVVFYSNIYREDGKFVHTRCFTLDVSERAGSIEAGQRLAAIVTSSEDAIASKDLNGIIKSWNAAAERMFGWTADEIIGRSVLTLIPKELHPDEDVILGKIRRGERIEHFETVRLRKDGELIQVSLTVSPIKDASGRIIGAAKIVRDITERKRSEQALRRAEKLAATGQLAATIAHEINNPMQALSNLLALINGRPCIDSETKPLVSLAEAELARMGHITRQMLSFYRETPSPVAIKLTEVLEDVLELFVLKAHANDIKIERRYESGGAVHGYPGELRQLFANLITNAMEAVGHKGKLRVHVTSGREWAGERRYGVRIVIADNGPGIAPSVRDQIFEPFFTTKAAKGTGLGLWVVKGVVAKHEGTMRLRTSTTPGRTGTVFSIFIPQHVAASWLAHQSTAAESAA